jgi:hypothetical protein
MYDRQERRAHMHGVVLVDDPVNAARAAMAHLTSAPGRPSYVNGALEAVERIALDLGL